jgi:hypothetical protein
LGSDAPAHDQRRAGTPAQITAPKSIPAGPHGSPKGAQIDARAQKATSKGLRGLFLRTHLTLAKGV